MDPLGIDRVEVIITIRPNGAANGNNDYTRMRQATSAPGAVLNATGAYAPEFTGLTSGDTVIKAEAFVYPKVMPNQLQNNFLPPGLKNVSVVIP